MFWKRYWTLDKVQLNVFVYGLTDSLDLEKAISYVFNVKNIHRIMANYLPENKASAKVLNKLGFIVEGRAKNYLRINGIWRDHILTSLTNNNWQTVTD